VVFIVLAVAVVLVGVTSADAAKTKERVSALEAIVADLQSQINNIQLLPGPPGAPGAQGPAGPEGPEGSPGTAESPTPTSVGAIRGVCRNGIFISLSQDGSSPTPSPPVAKNEPCAEVTSVLLTQGWKLLSAVGDGNGGTTMFFKKEFF